MQLPARAAGHTQLLEQNNGDFGTGWWPHLVFDKHDRAHIAYCDASHGDVRYGHEANGNWQIRSVVSQGAVGKYLAMDVDSRGQPGIAYYDQDKLYLRYASPDPAGTWSVEPVAWGREAGMGSTLRFDQQDRPHLFYYLASGKFIHALRTDAGWQKEVMKQATGVYSARTSAVAREDGVWVSFVDWQMRDAALYLGHVANDGNTTLELVNTVKGSGWHSQLLFDKGDPWLLHSAELTRKTAISRRNLAPGAAPWQATELFPHGSTFAAQRWRDTWVVAHQDTTDVQGGGVVRYAVSGPGPWQTFTVDDDGPVGGYLSLAVSSSGRMLLAYYADTLKSLKLYETQLAPAASIPHAAMAQPKD